MSITYSEIKGQYEALGKTMQCIDQVAGKIGALFSDKGHLIFIGSGSSYTLAKSAALTAELRTGHPSLAIPAGDLLLHAETYSPVLHDCTIIALSRSGETSEVIRAIEKLKSLGIKHRLLGLSCVADSPLSKMSDIAVDMPWAYDHSVCQTRTVSCLYFACVYLAAKLANDNDLLADLQSTVENGPAYMDRIEAQCKAIAEKDWTHAVVLGDAELKGICEEGALAFKEICQLPSNFYHVLDVRHGPMVLINDKTLVIAALSGADNELEAALVRDIVAKGSEVVVYSDEQAHIDGASSIHFDRPLAHPARGIPFIAICQLISYYKSMQTGANPDQPGDLKPWIAL